MAIRSGANQTFNINLSTSGVQQTLAAIQAVEAALKKLGIGLNLTQANTAIKEHEGVLHRLGETAEEVGNKLKEFGRNFTEGLGIGTGILAAEELGQSLKDLSIDIVSAATAGEQFTAQMQQFYGSAQAAGQVLEWTNKQALQMPYSVDQIRQSVAGLAATGQNIAQLLPALGNIAAAQHRPLTDLVDAFNHALNTGNMKGLVTELRMSKEQLEGFGLEVDKNGKIITSSLAPALQRLAETKFSNAMKDQANTFSGSMQVIGDSIDIFKEKAGEGLFTSLKGKFKGILDYLQQHQGAFQEWATRVGEALGTVLGKAIQVGTWIVHNFGPPIIAIVGAIGAAWNMAAPLIGKAIQYIQQVMGTIGTFLHDKLLPIVYQALGQVIGWWNAHAKDLESVIKFMWGILQVFWGSLSQNMAAALNILHGIWEVGWGLISGVFGGFIDLVTGNWKKFGEDMMKMAGSILIGIVDVFAGLVEKVIGIVEHLKDPINSIEHALYHVTSAVAGGIYDTFVSVEQSVIGLINIMIGFADQAIQKINHMFDGVKIAIPKAPWDKGPQKYMTFGGPHIGEVGMLDMPGASQTDRQNFMKTWSLGYADNMNLTFGKSADQAVQGVEMFRTQIDANIRKLANMPTSQQEGKTGQSVWTNITNLFGKYKAAVLNLPASDQDKLGGLPNLLPGFGGGTGGAAGTDPNKALQDAYNNATKHLQADIERGMSTNVLMSDRDKIRTIMLKEQKAGLVNVDDIFMEMNSTLKSIQDAVHQKSQAALDQANKVLQWEEILKMPQKVLIAQVNTIMKDLVATGIAPGSLEYRATRQQLMDQIAGSGSTTARPGEPHYGVAGNIRGNLQAGYGSVVAAFGGISGNQNQQIIGALRAQLAYWEKKAKDDDSIISHLRGTENNTRATAQAIAHIHFPAYPAGANNNGTARVRSTGAHTPIRN